MEVLEEYRRVAPARRPTIVGNATIVTAGFGCAAGLFYLSRAAGAGTQSTPVVILFMLGAVVLLYRLAKLVTKRRAGQAARASRPMRILAWESAAAALVFVIAVGAGVTTWLLRIASDAPQATLAAVKVQAISAGLGVAGGAGAAVLLALAFRRQWLQERAQSHNELDATERRITDLYGKAVDQLGNDHPEVRLAALFALHRLVVSYPTMRQMVTDVVCAYLGMPFAGAFNATEAQSSPEPAATAAEMDIRRSAQRILSAMVPNFNVEDWKQLLTAGQSVSVDLQNAVLVDLDLTIASSTPATLEVPSFTAAHDSRECAYCESPTLVVRRFRAR